MILERDINIDLLRFLGLTLIFLAHVQCPLELSEFRCFDVPLMIFVSGLTSSNKTYNYIPYIIRRTKRLVIPVWIFLILYLPVLYLGQIVHVVPDGYVDSKYVIDSFLLVGGVGYVWIIRVFLLIMLISPCLIELEKAVKSNIIYFIILILITFIQNYLVRGTHLFESCSSIEYIYQEFFLYLTGYVPLFMLGLRLRKIKNRSVSLIVIGCVICFFTLLIYYIKEGIPILLSENSKYPPYSYYIVYGLSACFILWPLTQYMKDIAKNKFVQFVSQNTIWIYLWHMPFALITNQIIPYWWLRYIIIYLSATGCFYIQKRIVDKNKQLSITKYLYG